MDDIPKQQLFSEFPPVSTPRWEEKIGADLKGAYREGKLAWKTGEGFDVKPYYRDEDLESLDYLRNLGSFRPVRRDEADGPNSWAVCQEIFPGKNSGIPEAGEMIREAVRGGAQAIRIHLDDLSFRKADMESMLGQVQQDGTGIYFTGSGQTALLYELLRDQATARGLGPAVLKGSPGADPLGRMVQSGIPVPALEELDNLVKRSVKETPVIRMIEVSGALIRNAGSTLVEELGMALAMANEYITLLSSVGTEPPDVAATLQMELATGPHYFMEIAKIRAARILWAKICEAWGMEPAAGKLRIHATTSTWNKTLYDPYTNMLRGTTEAMSSILGGADMVSVLPFDHPYGVSNAFSQRIARNVQIILREEAAFHLVADPASGTYYIESLTHSIAERSWELFREIEAMGGFRIAFESGWVHEKIAASKKVKMERAASGRDCILGTNAFPDFNETIQGNPGPLEPFRLSSMFENVRLETERSEKRPKVFLFKHGNPAWAAARATFAGNFFACAGYEIINPPAAPTMEAAIDAVRSSGAKIVVLCSADDAYTTLAPGVVEALGNECLLVVAGYPESLVEELRESGIAHFIHIGTNVLESLTEFNRLLFHGATSNQKPV